MGSSAVGSLTAPLDAGRFRWYLAAFAVGLLLDSGTTASVVGAPALRESNPVVAAALAAGGLPALLAIKLVPVAAAAGAFRLWFDDGTYARAVRLLVAGCGAVWTLAGLWNALLLA